MTGGSRSRAGGRIGRSAGRTASWLAACVVTAAAMSAACAGVAQAAPDGPATGAPRTGAAGAAPPQPAVPPGTVLRTGRFLTDPAGRVVFPRGVTVPAGRLPTAGEIADWLAFGFTGLRVEVPMTDNGHFPPSGEDPPPGDEEDGGLDQTAEIVRVLTDRGFTVVLRIVPGSAAYTPSDDDLAAGLRRLSARFAAAGGLIGYEIPQVSGSADLAGAVRSADAHHLLWREQPAPFDAAARVAVNDIAGYVTGWGDGSPRAAAGIADAGDAFTLGWFFDSPAEGATGIGAGEVRAPATAPAETVRAYPAAVAGVPDSFGSDPSGVFRLSYQAGRAGGGTFAPGTPSAVVVPAWAYPSGYQARVTGGQVTSAPGAGVLCVVASPGAARVTVELVPASGAAPAAPARAGADNCRAGAPGTAPVAGPGGVGGPAAGPGALADPGDEDSDPVLLVAVLPLLGAAVMAAVLGPVFMRLRRR